MIRDSVRAVLEHKHTVQDDSMEVDDSSPVPGASGGAGAGEAMAAVDEAEDEAEAEQAEDLLTSMLLVPGSPDSSLPVRGQDVRVQDLEEGGSMRESTSLATEEDVSPDAHIAKDLPVSHSKVAMEVQCSHLLV